MEKITVVVPAYNAERTIQRCIESIIDTDFDNYEIIIVDDGSTDESVNMIQNYVDGEKVKLIRQKNSGVSAARNVALENSTGTVITFVDSDDHVMPTYLNRISEAFETNDVDVVFWGFRRINDAGTVISTHLLPPLKEYYYDNILDLSQNDMFGYTWLKAFRKDVIGNIRFNESVSLFEDEIFTCSIMKDQHRLMYIDDVLYNYVKTEEDCLTKRVHQEYCRACDLVYCAWKTLIKQSDRHDNDNLENRSSHMNLMSKYYFLERNIKHIDFIRDWRKTSYLNDAHCDDPFVKAVRNSNWLFLFAYLWKYKLKNMISRSLRTHR